MTSSSFTKFNRAQWKPLLIAERNGIVERTVHGAICIAEADQILLLVGDDAPMLARSLTKPFQMKAVAKELEPLLDWSQRALSISSHSATERHQKIAKSILDERFHSFLKTPANRNGSQWADGCSGKHAAVLRVCQLKGWPMETYNSPDHPYFAAYLKKLREVFGKNWAPEVIAKDGCGLPAVSMQLSEIAKSYSWLVRDQKSDWIWEAFRKNPDLMGGEGRLDTEIIRASTISGHNLIAKEGADGLLGIAIEHPKHPKGLGIVIKLAHGYDPPITGLIAQKILRDFGIEFNHVTPLQGQKVWLA